jgi:PAS domain S-box-containing protein
MSAFQNVSIKRKQTLIIMLTSSVVLFLACASFITLDTVTFRRELSERVTILAEAVGSNCSAAIDFEDVKAAQEALTALRADGNIVAASVYSSDGRMFATYKRDAAKPFVFPIAKPAGHAFKADQLQVFRSIKQAGAKTGTIFVASDLRDISTRLQRYMSIVGLMFLTSLLIALALSSRLQRLVSDPILRLAEVARSVALEKNYSVRATKRSNDELGQLVDGFNEMLMQIQTRDTALRTARDDLENRVAERTMELQFKNVILTTQQETSIDGILVVGEKGNILSFNRRFVEMWKIPAALIGTATDEPVLEFVASQVADTKSFVERVRYLYEHRPENSQEEITLKDGRIFDRHSAPMFGSDDRYYGRIWYFRDITERKRAEEELKRSQSRLADAQRIARVGSWEWDVVTGKRSWSDEFFRLLGFKPGEIEPSYKTYLTRVHPDDRIAAEQILKEVLATKQPASADTRVVLPDGEVRILQTQARVIVDESGKVVRRVGTTQDVTETRQKERELLLAMSTAETATKAKSEFLASMSHEIRTPMNGVIGMTNFLLDSELSVQQRHYAEAISKSGESLLSVINDILDFSKIEAGKLTFETLDFDLHEAVEGCLELLAQRAQGKGLEVASLIESNVPSHLRGDPGRLRQILTNLVNNAIKFTERGEVVVKVSRESQTDTDVVLRFEIQDTGIGISAEAQKRLFQPFSQADSSTNRKYGGTGLGLAISKQLVEIMDGQIGVESAPDQGSTFWFTARLDMQPGAGAAPVIRKDLIDLHVLIVDDNESNGRILLRQTQAWKMRSSAATSAAEALATLRSASAAGDPYQVVLFDLHMPGTDGLVLAQSIRMERSLSELRLVLLSAVNERLNAEEMKLAGIDDWLVKPIKQSRLFDCLANLMDGGSSPPAGERKKVSAAAAASPAVGLKMRILLAEDNIVNQEVAQGLLRKLGYHADAVVNGAEALEAMKRVRYDVVLMDCQMPELDGYEATRHIRQLEQKRNAPFDWKAPVYIIAMTANAMQGDREKCITAGMNDYLSKPVRQNELKAALERSSVIETIPSVRAAAPSPDVARQEVAPAASNGSSSEEPLVDLDVLRDITDNEPDRLRRLIGLYLTQAAPMLDDLDTAIRTHSSGEVARLAHKLVGSSVSCGVQAFTQPLRELQRISNEGDLSQANALFEKVRAKFPRVESAFDHFLQTIPGDS